MVELTVLTGSQAGAVIAARRFPVRVGREPGMEFQSEEPGVWKQHATFELRDRTVWIQAITAETPVLVNGERVAEVSLKNGDLVDMGGLRLRFAFAPTSQKSLRPREILVWLSIVLLTLGQLGIIYWVLISVENDAFR